MEKAIALYRNLSEIEELKRMKNLPEQEYIHFKVRIGNLISPDVFPTRTIRNKDIPTFNKKLDDVVNYIEFVIKEHFNSSTQVSPSEKSDNNDFKKVCPICNGSSKIQLGYGCGNRVCTQCMGSGKPIPKS